MGSTFYPLIPVLSLYSAYKGTLADMRIEKYILFALVIDCLFISRGPDGVGRAKDDLTERGAIERYAK